MARKNITIKRSIHRQLYDYGEYKETLDDIINRLLDEAGDISQQEPQPKGSTSIRITPETLERINSLKTDESESYSSVLERALLKI